MGEHGVLRMGEYRVLRMGEHGVLKMGDDHGVLRMGEYRVLGMCEHGVPQKESTEHHSRYSAFKRKLVNLRQKSEHGVPWDG